MLGNALRGLSDVRRGAAFVAARPRLWHWVAAPFVLVALLLGALVWLAVRFAGPLLDRWLGALPGWLGDTLPGLLSWLLIALLLVAGYVVFVGVAMILAAPFNEMLSEDIEAELTGAPAERFSLPRFVRDLVVGLVHGLRRVALYLGLSAVLFAVGLLVPIAGPPVAAALGALVTARFAAYDSYDAVLARKRWAYRDKGAFLGAHRARTLGLGVAVAALLVVPLLNLLALPLGAAGATIGYLDLATSGTPGAGSGAPRPPRAR